MKLSERTIGRLEREMLIAAGGGWLVRAQNVHMRAYVEQVLRTARPRLPGDDWEKLRIELYLKLERQGISL